MWYVIGKFKGKERILAKANNMPDACYAVQSEHFKHIDEIEEIWYQSKESWEESRDEKNIRGDGLDISDAGGDNSGLLFGEFEEHNRDTVFGKEDNEGS